MTDFDSPWKEAIDLYFASFLQLLFPAIHADIDWARGYEFLDKELLQIVPEAEQGKGVVDKLVKVWLPDGQENWLLLHIEVQSQEESGFPLRMFAYNYRIFDRYNRDVVSVAVLGDDRANWRPTKYQFSKWGFRKEFEFPVAKLLDFLTRVDELEASANPMAIIVLAHLRALETRKNPEDRRAWKFRLIRNLYERGMAVIEVRQLFKLIDWLMMLPKELEIQFRSEMVRFEEEKHMPYVTSIERLAREEGLEKGLEQGLEQGLEKGLEKGRQKGRDEGLIEALEIQVEQKFGSDGLLLFPEISRMVDSDRLKKLLVAIVKIDSLEEFRQLLRKTSSP